MKRLVADERDMSTKSMGHICLPVPTDIRKKLVDNARSFTVQIEDPESSNFDPHRVQSVLRASDGNNYRYGIIHLPTKSKGKWKELCVMLRLLSEILADAPSCPEPQVSTVVHNREEEANPSPPRREPSPSHSASADENDRISHNKRGGVPSVLVSGHNDGQAENTDNTALIERMYGDLSGVKSETVSLLRQCNAAVSNAEKAKEYGHFVRKRLLRYEDRVEQLEGERDSLHAECAELRSKIEEQQQDIDQLKALVERLLRTKVEETKGKGRWSRRR